MAAKKYLELDPTTGRSKQRQATSVSSGPSNAGDLVALRDDGTLDPSMIPAGAGGDSVQNIVTTENLAAGDWVTIYNNAGTRACRRALATDTTKPAHGFVAEATSSGATAAVHLGGINAIPVSGYSVSDLGGSTRFFLSPTTPGATVKTIAGFITGQLVQPVGTAIAIDGSYLYVAVAFGEQVVF
jgi:hypothetical protein